MEELLALTPDQPRWVEARAMLLAGAPVTPAGAGFVIGHDAQRLLAAIGDVDPAAAVQALRPGYTLLCAIERADLAAAIAAAGWHAERAILHTLPDPGALPGDDGAVAIGPGVELALDHLPAELADEIAVAHQAGVIHVAFVDDAAVSFASAPWRTERWFDIAVDTAPSARQLGLATRVAAAMIRAERAAGREPVWGAAESNRPSRRLAAALGFVEVDALWVAYEP